MDFDAAVFPRQLRYWSLHCLLNAAPSLGIALGWMGLWKQTPAVVAMFTAIATFIGLYAFLTSLRGPFSDPSHLLSRSLALGARIRAWISGLSVLVLPTGILMIFTPDYWCGAAALFAVNGAARYLGTPSPVLTPDSGANTGFLAVYATTLLEGFLLSFLLLMISFFALLLLQSRERKKLHAAMARTP